MACPKRASSSVRAHAALACHSSFRGALFAGTGLAKNADISGTSPDYNKAVEYGHDYEPEGIEGDTAQYIVSFSIYDRQPIQWGYVFASRELPTFGGSEYNDMFSMTINGDSVAVLSNGLPVTINNLVPSKNDRSKDSRDYVDNPYLSCFPYTGYTRILTASGYTKVGLNTINISISDVSDGKYDSTVFLAGGSFRLAGTSWQPKGERTACSTTCGSEGTQQAAYVCVDPVGQVISDDNCLRTSGPRPLSQKTVSCLSQVPCPTRRPSESPTEPPTISAAATIAPAIDALRPADEGAPVQRVPDGSAADLPMCGCDNQFSKKPMLAKDQCVSLNIADVLSPMRCLYPDMETLCGMLSLALNHSLPLLKAPFVVDVSLLGRVSDY